MSSKPKINRPRLGEPENEHATLNGAWKDPFFRMPNEIIDYPESCSKLSTVQFAVYVVLCRYANKNGQAWPHYQKIAEGARCTRRAAINAVAYLEEVKLLKKTRQFTKTGDFAANHYVIYLPSQIQEEEEKGGENEN